MLLSVMAMFAVSPLVMADNFSEKIAGFSKKSGFFNIYGNEKKSSLLLEVDKLEQPFVYVTSLIQGIGSNDLGLDRGQIGDSRLVQFERIGGKIILRQLNPYFRADSINKSEVLALEQAFAQSVLLSFPIVAERKSRILIDVSKFVTQDVHGVADQLKRRGEGSYRVNDATSMALWSQSKTFPRNTELSALVTFSGQPKGKYLSTVTPDARHVSVRFRHSLLKLPEDGYKMREFHPYSGYYAFTYQDYSQPISKPLSQRYIYRHRLELDKQGKVVKPITFYLDPGVPEPIRGALLDGARWWSTAFDKAGYQGAFNVKMLPADADPLDVRYNVIQWVHRSTRGWSYGSSVSDPRTGEIMKSHVTLGSLRVRQDYLLASGLLAGQNKDHVSKQAQAMALARIRQLAAHEVGHTLGIAHNFAASGNNRASVMDYPHPLIDIKKGKISLTNAYGVGMGAWDDHSIKYGYGDLTKAQLTQLINKSKNSGLRFMSDSDARASGGSNPHAHLWDSGDKADVELLHLSKVRRIALSNMSSDMLDGALAQSELREAIVPMYLLHRFQVTAASKIIAGIDYNYAMVGETLVNKVVAAKWQRDALNAVLSTLTPEFLTLPAALIGKLPPKSFGFYNSRESFGSQNGRNIDTISMSEAISRHSLNILLNSARINRLLLQQYSDAKQLSLVEVLDQIIAKTITEFERKQPANLANLVAQRTNTVVIEQLLKALHNGGVSMEAKSVITQRLTALSDWLETKSIRGNKTQRAHFKLLKNGLLKGLSDKDFKLIANPAKLPPGSPI